MKYLGIIILRLLMSACSPAETTVSGEATADFDTQHMERMGFKVASAQPAPIDGLYEVITDQGLVYASANGQQIVSGRIFDITGDEPENISETVLERMRVDDLAAIRDTVIEYTAPEQKHV